MRLRDHVVIFERDPDFVRFRHDRSGSVLRVVRVWVAGPEQGASQIRHYLGSVRYCECGGWMSHRELVRLFRRATMTAHREGESARLFRVRLSRHLRARQESERSKKHPRRSGRG